MQELSDGSSSRMITSNSPGAKDSTSFSMSASVGTVQVPSLVMARNAVEGLVAVFMLLGCVLAHQFRAVNNFFVSTRNPRVFGTPAYA